MQEYGGDKTNDHREIAEGRERSQEDFHGKHPYSVKQKNYGSKEFDVNKTSYGRVTSGFYETSSNQQYQNTRYNSSIPTFSSPPNSPLVGVVFNSSSPNFNRSTMTEQLNPDKRSQSSWSISNQEPIGTGAKKKIVKSHEKRNVSSADARYHERYKDSSTETDSNRKHDRTLRADSSTSLDFFAEGERMVSELCNIPDPNTKIENTKNPPKGTQVDEDKNKPTGSSDILLTALDKIIIHDQIPIQIVQLAIEACTDAENIAIAHHNRPCFKNIHSICAKTRSNVQKPDSAVANLHSQGIPWVIKNFIFSFVRILDGWKGVKELLSEKHDTFSRIENKYYSPNIRECFVQWQAITKEMLTHIYKTFKCLDQGFTMEQKSFTHNYYATNSAAPRHQNQNKFQPIKAHVSTPRTINSSPQPYNAVQPPWMQSQPQVQSFSETPWSSRPSVNYKKFPVVPPPNSQNFYPLNDQNEIDYQKAQYKCDPYNVREAKPRQSWTITNVPDFRALENMCHSDQRELYNQLRHKMDAELGKAPGQPIYGTMTPCDLMQRRDMELKAKMIPLSHVEKTLIPSMATAGDIKNYVQKNNSCGDTKDDTDFFAAWGQMVQKESNDFLTHHTHNIQISSNVVTLPSNISGPVQFLDNENDEFHEMSKVYMKPGSYKVPIKPADPLSPFVSTNAQDLDFENTVEDVNALKLNNPFNPVTLAPQPKYNVESWPCLMSRRTEDIINEEQKLRTMIPSMEMRGIDCLDILNSMTSDRAWEAAKQSAPKLMDFLHDGSKTDTARLYNALGLCTIDEYSNETKQMQTCDRSDLWQMSSINQFNVKPPSPAWDRTPVKQDYSQSLFSEDILNFPDIDSKSNEIDDNIELNDSKLENFKAIKCPNFDQTGNYVKDENQKKLGSKSKVAISGLWYHPKKKKPLPAASAKKFEVILTKLSALKEATFIQHDMDIKIAPRFYEIVKYPMCLHDILTKLRNSSYSEIDQVIQDFRRIFNNVKLYLKSYPDTTMKKNVNKVAVEFENLLNEEFPIKMDTNKTVDTESVESNKWEKEDEKNKSSD